MAMSRQSKAMLKPLFYGFLVALVLHLWLVFSDLLPAMYRYWNGLFPRGKLSPPTEVTLVALSKRQWKENRKLQPELKVKEKQIHTPKEPVEEEKELKGQVVDLAPTPDSSVPKEYRFLSEHNTNAKKESVSRHQRKDYGVAQSRPTVAQLSRKKPDKLPLMEAQDQINLSTKKRGGPNATQTQQDKSLALEIPDLKKRQSLKLKLDLSTGNLPTYEASEQFMGNSDKMRLQMGSQKAKEGLQGEQGQDQQTVAMFRPSSLQHLDMITGAPANDYLRDVPKGEKTLLNSREFRFATFFNRIKRGVSNQWNPGRVYLHHDPYGNIYGVKDRHTVLNVVLDAQGGLKDVSVVQSSGLGFLDEEAISAFQGAAPFPNPPQALLESDGQIRFQFGFFFEIGERPRFQAFRRRYPF